MQYHINEHGDLVITATQEERKELQEEIEPSKNQWGASSIEAEALEKLIANSELDWVRPEWVGALTSAPMLVTYLEPRKIKKGEHPDYMCLAGKDGEDTWVQPVDKCWAYMDYQVRSFVTDLIEKGECVFQSGNDPEPNKTANLQFNSPANIPRHLIRSTIAMAQRSLEKVEGMLCRADFDKNEAMLELSSASGMLATVLNQEPETPKNERERRVRCLRAIAEYVRPLLGEIDYRGLRFIADTLEGLK